MFVCEIPGADAALVAWHATLHFGLAGLVASAGIVFLGLGVRAYRAPVVKR